MPNYYADFLTVPGHPELNGTFFNAYCWIRNVGPSGEWGPEDDDVPGSISRGYNMLKRSFDSMVLATLLTHEWYIQNTDANLLIISTNHWQQMIQGITNDLAPYNPIYVTLDYGCQYSRAMKTSRLLRGSYDTVSGAVTTTVSGQADLDTSMRIYTGQDNGITNITAPVKAFTNANMAVVAYMPGFTAVVTAPPMPPLLTGTLQSNLFAITFNTVPGQSYIVQDTGAFGVGGWSMLTNFTAAGTNITVYDTTTGSPEKFYRVMLTEAVTLTGSLQGTQFVLVFNAKTGRSYTVQYSDILGTWNTLTNVTGQGTNVAITNPMTSPQRIFRVSTPSN